MSANNTNNNIYDEENNKLVEELREHLKILKRSRESIRTFYYALKIYLRYLSVKGMQVVGVSSDDLEAYQGYLLGKYCFHTAYSYMRAVFVFYRFLKRVSIVVHNPTDFLTLLKRPRHLPRNVLTESEVATLLNAPDIKTDKGILHRAILETFYSSGLRISELCNLKVNDADTAKGYIRVNQGKGGKDRVVPIGNSACLWIRLYRETVRTKVVRAKSGDFLFLGFSLGNPIQRVTVMEAVKTYGKQAGITKKVSSHILRHACATHLMRNGASLLDVRGILGHVFLKTTQRYTHITQLDLIKAHRKFHPRK